MLDEILRENLLTMATALAEARGIKLATVGRLAHSDGEIFDRLAAGKGSITARKYDETMLYFRDPANWPEGVRPPRINEPWRRESRRNPGGRNGKAEVRKRRRAGAA